MTDNRVLVSEDGKEAVFCNRADGLGVEILRKAGYKMMILSTETNKVVRARAEKLRIPVIHGVVDKKTTLIEFCKKNKIKLSEVCFVGNDINDLEVMKIVGLPVCPVDAYPEIKKIAVLVSTARGGYGVVRELASHIMQNE
jgi:YrbI family 3-deoxy-D-manno-octulosonate 8-phosphate phosphatase